MIKKRKQTPAVTVTADELREVSVKTGLPPDEIVNDTLEALKRAKVVEAHNGAPQPNLKGGK